MEGIVVAACVLACGYVIGSYAVALGPKGDCKGLVGEVYRPR